ncbi:hypothetical protein GCM10009872_29810 [Actinopolymorpha rutila]
MNCQALVPGPTEGCPYIPVGMHRALESAIGLPSKSTRASRMLVFVTPPDVRRSFKTPPDWSAMERSEGQTWGHREILSPLNAAKIVQVHCVPQIKIERYRDRSSSVAVAPCGSFSASACRPEGEPVGQRSLLAT